MILSSLVSSSLKSPSSSLSSDVSYSTTFRDFSAQDDDEESGTFGRIADVGTLDIPDRRLLTPVAGS